MLNKHKKILFILIIVLMFFLIYGLNIRTMLADDDYAYHFVFSRIPNSYTKRITNPFEIFNSMAVHWRIWGGRVVVHALLQFILLFGIPFFNVVNSVMFILYGYLIYKHINYKEKFNYPLLLFIYLIIFLFAPDPASVFMWKSGSANYLWSTVLILCMTLIYKKYFDDENAIKDYSKNTFLIFLFGLIVGCTNENSGCAIVVLQITYIILYRLKYKMIPKWAISGLIGCIVGYIFLIAAPGNYVRADQMYPIIDWNIKTFFERLGTLTIFCFFKALFGVTIFLVLSVILTSKKGESLEIKKNKYATQLVFLIFALATIYSLILSPVFYIRCFFFAFTYFLIIIGINLNYLDLSKKSYRKITISIIIILLVISTTDYVYEYHCLNLTYKEIIHQRNSIIDQRNDEIEDVVVAMTTNHTGRYNKFVLSYIPTTDKDDWLNLWMAKYYKINSIIGIDEQE